MSITENFRSIRSKVPQDVKIIVAAKQRTVDEVREVIDAGATDIGENYVQEAREKKERVKGRVRWHMNGHLQSNKAKAAVELFDVFETVDREKILHAIFLEEYLLVKLVFLAC